MTEATAERRPGHALGHPAVAYFLLCVGLWVAVDWGTAGGFRPSYLARYMPGLLLFYLGYPAVFVWFVFRLRMGTSGLLAATALAIVVVEVMFVHNPWLTTLPLLLVGIPLALAVYAPLTFFPLWVVRGEMARHRRLVAALVAVEAAVTLLTVLGSGG
jgi:hypothetical protein